MTLTLYYHPLSSFCWKVLVALYDAELPFRAQLVDLGNASERDALCKLWPPGRFPVLHDDEVVVPESSIIIEHFAQRHAAARSLVPVDPEAALCVRARDRLFDLDLHVPMQKIVGDRFRPADQRDPLGVASARRQLRTGYTIVEDLLAGHTWACGETFTLADCAAAPALWYGDRVEPIGEALVRTRAYLARLRARPSFARVLAEAEPYRSMFPA
jgi:glutathione S-transferase